MGGSSPDIAADLPATGRFIADPLAPVTVQVSCRSYFLSNRPRRHPRLAQQEMTMHTARKYEHKQTNLRNEGI